MKAIYRLAENRAKLELDIMANALKQIEHCSNLIQAKMIAQVALQELQSELALIENNQTNHLQKSSSH